MYFRFLALLLIMALPFKGSGQFIFQNLNEEDGLGTRETSCLYLDRDGFLWIGSSDGLNRFDGNVIKHYNGVKGQKSYYVNAIYPINGEDNLLVATRQGVMIFDKHTGYFTRKKEFEILAEKKILAVKKDGLDRLWLIGKSEIYLYDHGKIDLVDRVIPETKILQGQNYSFSAASAFCWDSLRSGFWVGGYQPFFIDIQKNVVYTKGYNPLRYPILEKEFITAIALDHDHNVWYGSNTDFSINFWNAKEKREYKYVEMDGKKLTDGFNYIYIDSKDRLWASTWTYSAYFKAPGAPFRKIPYSQDEPNSIAYGHFQDAVEDTEGNIWFATINGLSKNPADSPLKAIYKLPSFNFTLDTGFAHANAILVDKNMIVAAKEDGVVFYNMDRRNYQHYQITTGPDLIRNKFLAIAKAEDKYWFAGLDGVYYLKNGDTQLRKFNKIEYKSSGSYCNFIFQDSLSRIWFHIINDALYRYDPKSDRCARFDGSDSKRGMFPYHRLQSFLKLRDGNLLFAMDSIGFLHYDMDTEHFTVRPFKNRNFYIGQSLEDETGRIWSAAGGRGLLRFNLRGQLLDSVTNSTGHPFDQLSSLAMDSHGLIWQAGSEGMLLYDRKTRDVVRFRINLGKTLQDYWNGISVVGNKLYAIMLDHVVVIDPSKLSTMRVSRAPNITSVKIFEKEITGLKYNKTLKISSEEDFITFQFTSLKHRDLPTLQYSYMLEGLDPKWVNSGRSMIVSYNHLPAGKYVFKVRSTDESGRWMQEINRILIEVTPQWWQSLWFFSTVTSVVTIFLSLTYISYVAKKRKRELDTTIEYFANSVYGENSINEICWDITRNCISQLHFEDCVVYLFDPVKNKLVQKAIYGPKNLKGHEIFDPLELEIGQGIVGTAAATGKPVLVRDTSRDKRYIVDDKKRKSELAVPIIHEGRVLGVVDSENSKRNFFNRGHTRALMTIASISATKIAEAMAEDEAHEKEIMLLEISRMLAESQLMALRAQMNPHFVFNCLNSIQECIVTEKYGEASKYLNKFSKLFRSVLNNSDKNLVTIEEEREVLELYLQLEQMRFERSFGYRIVVDEDLEDDIVLPSMLLQPYVENALWHGLMHKDRDRDLTVAFRRVNDEIFECIIEDNGIGREKSFEIKLNNTKARRHKSKGLQITQDRLNLLQRQGQFAEVNIIDKKDSEGKATGTKVVIQLSTFLRNI